MDSIAMSADDSTMTFGRFGRQHVFMHSSINPIFYGI
jgi:hypothetical protein